MACQRLDIGDGLSISQGAGGGGERGGGSADGRSWQATGGGGGGTLGTAENNERAVLETQACVYDREGCEANYCECLSSKVKVEGVEEVDQPPLNQNERSRKAGVGAGRASTQRKSTRTQF